MWKNKWDFNEGYSYVKSKRSCIDLNIGFCSQLNQWNKQLTQEKAERYTSKTSLEKDERLYELDISTQCSNLKISNCCY